LKSSSEVPYLERQGARGICKRRGLLDLWELEERRIGLIHKSYAGDLLGSGGRTVRIGERELRTDLVRRGRCGSTICKGAQSRKEAC